MHDEEFLQTVTVPPERLFEDERDFQGIEVINLTGYSLTDYQKIREIRDWLKDASGKVIPAEKFVLFPDISPTEEGRIPTGCIAEFDIKKTPDFLKHVRGADIGCGMSWAFFKNLTEKDFREKPQLLNELKDSLITGEETALGGGNHFLDFVVDEKGQVAVVIHTGASRNKQEELEGLFKEDGSVDQDEYMEKYQGVIRNSQERRQRILEIVSEVYGELEPANDQVHNTVRVDRENNKAFIYKGVIYVKDLDFSQQLLLPSSVNDKMILYRAGSAVNEENLWGVPHGTGRQFKREEIKAKLIKEYEDKKKYQQEVEKGRIPAEELGLMTPDDIMLPLSEHPNAYYSHDRAFVVMVDNGLMDEDNVAFLTPIAYLGHLPENRK